MASQSTYVQLHNSIITNDYNAYLKYLDIYNFELSEHIISSLLYHQPSWLALLVKKYISLKSSLEKINELILTIFNRCSGPQRSRAYACGLPTKAGLIAINIINEIENIIQPEYIYVQFAKTFPDYALQLEVVFDRIILIFAGVIQAHRFDIATKIINKCNSKELLRILTNYYILHSVVYYHDVECLNYLLSLGKFSYEHYIHTTTINPTCPQDTAYPNVIKAHGLLLFEKLCVSYSTIVISMTVLPLEICNIIDDYTNNLIFLVSKFETIKSITLNTLKSYYEIILKYGCRDYRTIAKRVFMGAPSVMIPFLDKLTAPYPKSCDSKDFVIEHFGIIPPFYQSKKRKSTSSDTSSESSLLKIFENIVFQNAVLTKQIQSNENRLIMHINAFSNRTLKNIVRKYYALSINPVCMKNRYYLTLFVMNTAFEQLRHNTKQLHLNEVLLLCCGILTTTNFGYLSISDQEKFALSYGHNITQDNQFLRNTFSSLCEKRRITSNMMDVDSMRIYLL